MPSQGDGWVVPVAVVAALTDDPVAADAAMAAAEPVWQRNLARRIARAASRRSGRAAAAARDGSPWLRAARLGLADPALARAAQRCFEAAEASLASGRARRCRSGQAVAEFAEQYVRRGRCPADDILDTIAHRKDSHDHRRRRQHAPRRDRGQADHRPRADPRADRLRRRGRPDPPALAADVPAGLGPGPRRQPGRAVAAPRRRRPRSDASRKSTRCTTPSSIRGPSGPACRCCRPRRHAATRAMSAAACSTCSSESASPPGPLVDQGFVFGMIAQHEQQHDETMLATHQLRRGGPVLTAPPPGPAPADVLRLPAEVLVRGGPFTMGTSTEPWALDNERPAHVVDLQPFYLDTTPVTNAALRRIHRRRRLPPGAAVEPGGLAAPAQGQPDRAAVLGAGRRWPVASAQIRRDRAGAAGRAGHARLLVRGGRVRPLGWPAAAVRGRVGEGREIRPRIRPVPQVPVG